MVQTTRSKGESARSITDRFRKRSNPLAISLAVALVVVLVAIGTASVLWDRAEKEKNQFARQMIGNWELVPGQSQLERWDFAFHANGQLQMALGNQLNDGHWKIVSVRGPMGYVLIDWPDDAPETMRVRFERGTMEVKLDSVGNFTFRAALP